MINLSHDISIIMFGGIFVYSILIIIQVLIVSALAGSGSLNISTYILVEVNKYIKNKNNIQLYWILRNCALIIIITTLAHIIIKIGIYNSISYNINYWLIGTGLGLYLTPFIIYGYSMFIYIINYNIYQLSIHNMYKHNNLLNNCYSYVKQIYTGSNYNNSYMFSICDLSSIMNLYRGLNNIMNWLYQMIYYGVRLWLVFVLHSFSLGCFGELITVITDNNMILNVFYFGFLGLGLMLFLLVVFYLGIQIYVYISFSLSFLHSTILLLFTQPISPSTNLIPSSTLSISNSYLLIPVSLVDVFSLNMIFYIIILYSVLLFFIPILLSCLSHVKIYSYIYNNLS